MCWVYCKKLSTLNWGHPNGVGRDTELVSFNKRLNKVATLKLHCYIPICKSDKYHNYEIKLKQKQKISSATITHIHQLWLQTS